MIKTNNIFLKIIQERFANVLGFNDKIPLLKVYNGSLYKSEKLRAKNQRDSLFVDFGYVTTPAPSRYCEL